MTNPCLSSLYSFHWKDALFLLVEYCSNAYFYWLLFPSVKQFQGHLISLLSLDSVCIEFAFLSSGYCFHLFLYSYLLVNLLVTGYESVMNWWFFTADLFSFRCYSGLCTFRELKVECFSKGRQAIDDYSKLNSNEHCEKNKVIVKALSKGLFPIWLSFIPSYVVRFGCHFLRHLSHALSSPVKSKPVIIAMGSTGMIYSLWRTRLDLSENFACMSNILLIGKFNGDYQIICYHISQSFESI